MARHLKTGEFIGGKRAVVSTERLVVSEVEHVQRTALPEHTHESAFFCVLLQGAYWEQFGRTRIEYRPWSVGFHPEAFTHHDHVGNGGGRLLTLELKSAWLRRLQEDHPQLALQPGLVAGDAPLLARRLYMAFRRGLDTLPIVTEGLALEMIASAASRPLVPERRAPDWLRRAKEMLHESFTQPLTVQQVAEELDLHPVYVARCFRQFEGRTMGDYLVQLRIASACQMLEDSAKPLAQVAMDTGFSDQSHLTRVFRQVMGATPGAYRAGRRAA